MTDDFRLVGLKRANPEYFTAIFEQDGARVEKHVRISNPYIAAGQEQFGFHHELLRRAREAVRDFAYMKHGPEKWKEHVEWGGFFDAPTDAEKQMIEAAFDR